MTPTPIEDQLAGLLDELATDHPVETPSWESVCNRQAHSTWQGTRRTMVAVAAIAAIVGLIGIAVALRLSPEPETGPAEVNRTISRPVLLVPSSNGPIESATEPQLSPPFDGPRGAVSAPDGTIFSLSVAEATTLTEIPGEQVELAGFEAIVTTDGSAPTQIYRTVDLGCLSLTVTTADAPPLNPELSTLMESMTVEGNALRVNLPSGWTSHGAAGQVEQYFSTLRSDTGAGAAEYAMAQSPGTPIGFYLFGETAPVLLASDGEDQLWFVAAATTPVNTLVGTRFGTAFTITSEASVDELEAVVDSFTAAESPDALAPSAEPGAEATTTTEQMPGIAQDCPDLAPILLIVE